LAKPETEKRPPAASSDRKPASEHLATIGRGFGLRVLRVTKYGGEQDGTFEIAVECQDGIERKVDLGRAIDVLNPRLTQGAIAGAIGAVIPNFKKGDSYLNLCRSIFAAAGPAPVELASDQQELLAWLRQFAAERYIPALNESEKRALGDRLNEGAFAGMWNERGELLLYLPFFLSVLFAVARVRPTWKDVTLRLRKLGFRPCDLEGVDSGGHRRRVNVWRSQPGLDRELGLVGDSGGSPTNPPIRRNISFSSTDIGDSGEVGKVALN
jgi:hypothetical protein